MNGWQKLAPGVWEHSGQIYAMAQMVALDEACGFWSSKDGTLILSGASEAEVERIAAEIVEKRRNGGKS